MRLTGACFKQCMTIDYLLELLQQKVSDFCG